MSEPRVPRGLNEKTVILRHALKNALVPIITLSTLLFGELLAGAVLTEQIFTIPGFGKLIVDAVFTRDYAVVQGRGAVHRRRVHPDEPRRRPSLHRRQPAPERCSMTAVASVQKSPLGRQLSKFARNKAAVAGAVIVGAVRADRGLCTADCPL